MSVSQKFMDVTRNFLAPINTLYLLPISLTPLFDILSPFGPFLLIASIGTAVIFVMHLLINKMQPEEGTFFAKWKHKITTPGKAFYKNYFVFYTLVALMIFSCSAMANYNYQQNGGMLAKWNPKIKHWQDAYLVSIKKDTEAIRKSTDSIESKIDKNNQLLTQMLQTVRPQLEKVLVEEIPQYSKLAKNQQDALVYFTSKVGTNGIRRYKGLIKQTNNYLKNPSVESARKIADHLNLVVRINGKTIEDTRTKKLLMALFLEPATYEYLMGNTNAPSDSLLLKEFNIDVSRPIDAQIDDPLGDYLALMEKNDIQIKEEVVIPKQESIATTHTRKRNIGAVSSSFY